MVFTRITFAAMVLIVAAACGRPEGTAEDQGAVEQNVTGPQDPTTAPSEPSGAVVVQAANGARVPGENAPHVLVPPEPEAPPAPVYDNEFFVSVSGSDAATGTSAAPFRSIMKAVRSAGPGDRIVVRAGTYREDVLINSSALDGTEAKKILLQGEGKPKVVPTGATSTVFHVQRKHWIVDGFEVHPEARRIFAVAFSGATNGSVLRNSELHGGTGAGVNIFGGASGVTVENNKIHHFDAGSIDAHGVAIQWTTKNITVRGNMIYANSGDSVQCEGPEPYGNFAPADGLLIENNDMSMDRENAVDIKTCFNVTIRNNNIHDYTGNGGTAVVIHMSPRNVVFENNLIENVGKAIALGGNRVGAMPQGVVIRQNKLRNISTARGPGEGMRIENADHPVIANNTVLNADVAAIVIGGGTGGPTDGLKLANNILAGSLPLKIGGSAPGFISVANLFESGSRIQTSGGAINSASWIGGASDDLSKVAPAPLTQATWTPISAAINAGSTTAGLPMCGGAPDIGAVETGC